MTTHDPARVPPDSAIGQRWAARNSAQAARDEAQAALDALRARRAELTTAIEGAQLGDALKLVEWRAELELIDRALPEYRQRLADAEQQYQTAENLYQRDAGAVALARRKLAGLRGSVSGGERAALEDMIRRLTTA